MIRGVRRSCRSLPDIGIVAHDDIAVQREVMELKLIEYVRVGSLSELLALQKLGDDERREPHTWDSPDIAMVCSRTPTN
jgi:hypothetical protein